MATMRPRSEETFIRIRDKLKSPLNVPTYTESQSSHDSHGRGHTGQHQVTLSLKLFSHFLSVFSSDPYPCLNLLNFKGK